MATQSHQQFGGSKLATQRVGLPYFVLDNRIRHYRAGAAPKNWHRNGELLYQPSPAHQVTFTASDQRALIKLLGLLFLLAHREATRFF